VLSLPAALLRPAIAAGRAETCANATQPGGSTEALCLPSPDWLKHRLVVSGPAVDLAAFQVAAAGPGVIPWRQAVGVLAEEWFNRMVAVPVPQRTISVAGAHSLADELREAVEACAAADAHAALDLHALIPVPADLLARGADDPAAVAWLWAHWGTTWPLRHVAARSDPPDGQGGRLLFRFHAADWSPWPALHAVRARWPALRFELHPDYETPSSLGPAPGPARRPRRKTDRASPA